MLPQISYDLILIFVEFWLTELNSSENAINEETIKCLRKFFKDKDNKVMSVLEKAEAAYNQIKTQIDMLLSKPETDDDEEISAQNTDMLEYFNQLNQIVSFLSDNTKIPTKMKNEKKPEKNADPSKNNEKIMNIYKKENEK